ncbi:hypothetical protein CTAYLR_009496 [Chrysophaeum taylorii]|uniref:Protein kinase domain-containing protein n=1 Tax=Chrysophaeum taylorii TaxID=2483200 RepID=A0AAD7UKH9_9STRA|nr:hypothetical protein CTAYLR_009496 [Chrysophaeum taylorii]
MAESEEAVKEKAMTVKELGLGLPKCGDSMVWLKHKLSLRRPEHMRRMVGESQSLSGYIIGKGSTRKKLPKHLLDDGFEVPMFDCSKLPVLKQIGSGSQAIVYRVDYGGKTFAVKALRKELAQFRDEHLAFEREVNLLARLAHPHINNAIGIGEVERSPAAVLEWCDSTVSSSLRLKDITRDPTQREGVVGHWPSLDRIRLAAELASAMKFLHGGNALPRCVVVHRDLKPDNLGLCHRTLKLLDFGLAVCLENDLNDFGEDEDEDETKYDLTAETGTRRYMAPEVTNGDMYGAPCDVYSFAMTTWEFLGLYGKPFPDFDLRMFKAHVVRGNLRPTIPRGWHPALQNLMQACWDRDPHKRPTFDLIADELYNLLNSLRQPRKQYSKNNNNKKNNGASRASSKPRDPLATNPPTSFCPCCS